MAKRLLKPKQVRVNIRQQPVPMPEAATGGKCFTVGDMHGNALKLLNTMILTGAATLPTGAPPANIVKLLGLKKSLEPNTYYQLFVEIYDKPIGFWNKDNIAVLQHFLGALEINKNAHLRLIGDELADRGKCDYFTLKLLEKLKKGGAEVEILLSNHGAEFIKMHEAGKDYEDSLGDGQAASAANLQVLIDAKAINQSEVNGLYDNVYKGMLKIIAYDLDDGGNIANIFSIYTHARMGEAEILDMGYGILDYANMEDYADLFPFTKTELRALKKLITRLDEKMQNGESINGKDFRALIDEINRVVTYNAGEKTLGRMIELGFNEEEHLKLSKDDQRERVNGHDLDARKYPFYKAIWNRDTPKPRPKDCEIRFNNGHDTKEDPEHPSTTLDNDVGKSGGKQTYIHNEKKLVSHSLWKTQPPKEVQLAWQEVSGTMRMGMVSYEFEPGTIISGIWEYPETFTAGKIENGKFTPGVFTVDDPRVKGKIRTDPNCELITEKSNSDEGDLPVLVTPSSRPKASDTFSKKVELEAQASLTRTTGIITQSARRGSELSITEEEIEWLIEAYIDYIHGDERVPEQYAKDIWDVLMNLSKMPTHKQPGLKRCKDEVNELIRQNIVQAYANCTMASVRRSGPSPEKELKRLEALYVDPLGGTVKKLKEDAKAYQEKKEQKLAEQAQRNAGMRKIAKDQLKTDEATPVVPTTTPVAKEDLNVGKVNVNNNVKPIIPVNVNNKVNPTIPVSISNNVKQTTPSSNLQQSLQQRVIDQQPVAQAPARMVVPASIIVAPTHPAFSKTEASLNETPIHVEIKNRKAEAIYTKAPATDQSKMQGAAERAVISAIALGQKQPLHLTGKHDGLLVEAFKYCIVQGIAFEMPAEHTREYALLNQAYLDSGLVNLYQSANVGSNAICFVEKDLSAQSDLELQRAKIAQQYQLPVPRPDEQAVAKNIDAVIAHNSKPSAQLKSKL